jgi:hypothetical protein
MLSMKNFIQQNGIKKHKHKLMVLITPFCKSLLQQSPITITELMHGLTHNMKNLTNQNGKQRLQKLHKVVITSQHNKIDSDLLKDPLQQYQITTIESMLGLILNLKNLMKKNGMLRPLKLLKVAIMLLLNKVTDSDLLKDQPQLFQITIIELMHGLILNTKKVTKKSGLTKHKN